MKRTIIVAVLIIGAMLSTSCEKFESLFSTFDDQDLIEELPTNFKVMRTYVGKKEANLEQVLLRLGCEKSNSDVWIDNGWNPFVLYNNSNADLSYYTYNDGADKYVIVLNSTTKSGKTFQVFWSKVYDTQWQAGLEVLADENTFTNGRSPSNVEAKTYDADLSVDRYFDTKEEFSSYLNDSVTSVPLWGMACTYGLYEITQVFYSQTNYGSSYYNSSCLTNKDIDIDLSSITNRFSSTFSTMGMRTMDRSVSVGQEMLSTSATNSVQ